jgi:hypothetical protein
MLQNRPDDELTDDTDPCVVEKAVGRLRLGVRPDRTWRGATTIAVRKRSSQRLLSIKHDRVAEDGCRSHERHAANRREACKIKQQKIPIREEKVRMDSDNGVADGKQDSDLRWTKDAVGNVKTSERVSRKIALDGEHVKAEQHAGCDLPVKEAGATKSRHGR